MLSVSILSSSICVSVRERDCVAQILIDGRLRFFFLYQMATECFQQARGEFSHIESASFRRYFITKREGGNSCFL